MRDVIPGPAERVAEMAERRPRDPAIFDVRDSGNSVWTWSELERQTERTAALLAQLGVGRGEVVAYQLPNRAEFVAITLGALRLGAICCPLMPIFRERELEDLLRRARAPVVFAVDEYRGRRPAQEIASLEPRLPLLKHGVVVASGRDEPDIPCSQRVTWTSLHRASDAIAAYGRAAGTSAPDPNGLAQLLFTSGTSGEPKGVLHHRDTLTSAVAMEIEHLGLGADDRIYVPSPLAHQTGFLYGMWLALMLGVPQIVQETWDPVRGLEAFSRAGATFVQAATPFLADLVQAVEDGADPPRSLRTFVATGAAVP
ncbi:MAG: AMP-binding protein, partial [Steroidobacteraceae bacterium]